MILIGEFYLILVGSEVAPWTVLNMKVKATLAPLTYKKSANIISQLILAAEVLRGPLEQVNSV